MISEKNIIEEYQSNMGYYIIEQQNAEFKARQYAIRDTTNWLKENGFDARRASSMVIRALKGVED